MWNSESSENRYGAFLLSYISKSCLHIQIIKGTCDTGNVFVHHMGVTLCGFDVRMPHEFLQHSDIGAVFQHGGGKAMPQGMAGNSFINPGPVCSSLHRFLQP